jgi:hypothetical protein
MKSPIHREFAVLIPPIQQQIHHLLKEGASYDIAKREKIPLAKSICFQSE